MWWVQELLDPPLLLDLDELTKIGGLFLTVLITVELFGILEVMLLKNAVHVEFVVAVALIAAAREVLVVEVTSVAPMTLVGLAALILALGVGYPPSNWTWERVLQTIRTVHKVPCWRIRVAQLWPRDGVLFESGLRKLLGLCRVH